MDPVTDAFTAIGAEITNMSGQAWPIVTSLMVALIGIGLFKKFVSKAT